jgi:hypothetical protein
MSTGNQQLIFWALFLALSGIIIFFDQKYGMLRDASAAVKKPFSFARVQLAWWTVIVLSSFITILITKGVIPTFDPSTLILLGISAATTGAARVIDQSDQSNPAIVRGQDQNSQDFFLDILSDGTGPNMHRFQTVVFNLVFGIWFITSVLHQLGLCKTLDCIDTIMPKVTNNNLILLGLSSGVYAALKMTENKTPADDMPDKVADESGLGGQGVAQG